MRRAITWRGAAILVEKEESAELLEEVLICYSNGAYRAALVTLWIAATNDLVGKIQELAVRGDRAASRLAEDLDKALAQQSTQDLLAFERRLLKEAESPLELVSATDRELLTRLRDDRNRCAHPPSLLSGGDFRPTAELVAAHIRAVSDVLLTQPASQGKAALETLLRDLESAYFPSTRAEVRIHLSAGSWARPRRSLLRNLLIVLLKGLRNPGPSTDPPFTPTSGKGWRRRANVLAVFEELYPAEVGEILGRELPAFVESTTDEALPALLPAMCEIRDFAALVGLHQLERIKRATENLQERYLVGNMLSLWGAAELRTSLMERLRTMRASYLFVAAEQDGPVEWVGAVMARLESSRSFDESNHILRSYFREVSGWLSDRDFERVIEIAQVNSQVRDSFGFGEFIRDIVRSSDSRRRRDMKDVVEAAGFAGLLPDEPPLDDGEHPEAL